MHDVLGDRVNVWTTLNEPWCSSFLSYTAGEHAPGRTSIAEGLLASHHLLLAHGKTVQELRSRDASLHLGITLNHTVADPADPLNPADVDAARRVDGQLNRWFLDPIYRGSYPADIVDDVSVVDADAVAQFEAAVHDGDLEVIAQQIDTQGVNYYHGDFVAGAAPLKEAVSVEPATERVGRSPYPSSEGIHAVERGLPRTAQNLGGAARGTYPRAAADLDRVRGACWHGAIHDRERRGL